MSFWDNGKARDVAGRLMAALPAWLVLWGAYTREFWAFPCFAAPPGTVLHDTDPSVLAGRMKQVQQDAARPPADGTSPVHRHRPSRLAAPRAGGFHG
jgi:hypothetical protein